MYLYHYYDFSRAPFLNLSDLPRDKAEELLEEIKRNSPDSMSAGRNSEYVALRLYYEEVMREKFVELGGIIKRTAPHYMVVGECEWLSTWFENSAFIKIHISEFDLQTVSFTYGDSHPTFSPRINDGLEYRKRLYDYNGILELIKKYGLPQENNPDGKNGDVRYIEAQIWSDETINKYIAGYNQNQGNSD